MVYLSEHRSLAALEVFLQPQPLSATVSYVIIAAQWDDSVMELLPAAELPSTWRSLPSGPASASIGDRWMSEARSAVLAVPSAIIPAETNFLINPAHPEFRRIRIGKPTPFDFDPRLLDR